MLHQLVSMAMLLSCVVMVVRMSVVVSVFVRCRRGQTGGRRSWDEAGGRHGVGKGRKRRIRSWRSRVDFWREALLRRLSLYWDSLLLALEYSLWNLCQARAKTRRLLACYPASHRTKSDSRLLGRARTRNAWGRQCASNKAARRRKHPALVERAEPASASAGDVSRRYIRCEWVDVGGSRKL